MARYKNINWSLHGNETDKTVPNEHIKMALLMDIRDELQSQNAELRKLNSLLHCSNFIAIPRILRRVSSNTANLPKVKKEKAP